ncbi:MAG TPA: Xaa-Pro peptidase family protein [Terriglobales bacterium]|nr:Xaa-Pro peptidase family protein [Terriglobales bacterium]
MRSEIASRQVAAMEPENLDAIISCSPENFAYVTGFVVPSQPLIRHRHAMAIVTRNGDCAILGVDMEATTLKKREPNTKTRIWSEFSDNCTQVLASLLAELGLSHAKIGIETDYLPARDMVSLQACLPGTTFVPAEDLLSRLRQIKTQDEISLLRHLSRIADQSITDAIGTVRAGSSEMDIAAALTRNIYALGAEHFKLMIVATGERSQLPNVGPTERRLQPQDVCRIEIFSVMNGYHAGVCRTAVVRDAPPNAEGIWRHLVECKYQIMEMIKPGASCRAIYRAFIKKLEEMNLPPISFVGHGIGLHLHENPYLGKTPILGKTTDAELEPGMVLGVEPLCYQTGYGFGMQNKDMILVTKSGCELLSDYANTDKLLVIQ